MQPPLKKDLIILYMKCLVTASHVDFANSWMMSQTNWMKVCPDKDTCVMNTF